MQTLPKDHSGATSYLYDNGVLENGEEILSTESFFWLDADKRTNSISENARHIKATICFVTNMRLIVVGVIRRFTRTEYSVFCSWSYDDIISITPTMRGIFTTTIGGLKVSIKSADKTKLQIFTKGHSDTFVNTLIDQKKIWKPKKVIQAQNIIIQEGKNEGAIKILQKRLARGEITIEEFHQIVQRL